MRVLITGKNSFLGNKVGSYLEEKSFFVDYISLKDDSWVNQDFSIYQVLIHVAGIAHVSYKNENKDLYDEVNHQLTEKVALKAKKEGINQFVFLSSMIVYSPYEKRINNDTPPSPKGPYATSKLNAELALNELKSDDFKVVILRPSVIYGPGSKGNIPKLIKLVKKFPLFPKFKNQRSFLYVGNLAEAIYMVISKEKSGTYHLADKTAISTTELVDAISRQLNKKIHYTKLLNPLIKILKPKLITIQKLFGDFYYESSLIQHSFEYHRYGFEEAIKLTINGESHG